MKRKMGVLVMAAALAVLMVPALAFGASGWHGCGFGNHVAWCAEGHPFAALCEVARQALAAADEEGRAGDAAAGAGAAADMGAVAGDAAVVACPTCSDGCAGFVDENGDGVCDRWDGAPCTNHDGCPGYVDADNDGVCDHYDSNGYGYDDGSGRGAHHGGGHRHGTGCGRGGHGRCWR